MNETMKRLIYLLGFLLYHTFAYKIIIRLRKNRKKIIVYHDVDDNINPFVDGLNITVEIKAFEKHMEFLKKHYKVVNLDIIIKSIKEKQNSDRYVAITFDDGYKSFYRNAFPILKKNNFPATVFLIEKCLNDHYYMWRNRLCYLINCNESLTISNFIKYFSKNQTSRNIKFINKNKKEFLKSTAELPSLISVKEVEKLLDMISNTEKIKEIKLYIDIKDCERLSKYNIAFGNHSTSHFEFKFLNDNEIWREIKWKNIDTVASINFMSHLLALPRGAPTKNSEKIEKIAKNCDVKCIFYANGLDNSIDTNIFRLGRIHRIQLKNIKYSPS